MNNEINLEELIKNRVDMTEKDEYMHDWGAFPKYHNESWYFNFIDRPNKVFFVGRLTNGRCDMGTGRSRRTQIVSGRRDRWLFPIKFSPKTKACAKPFGSS